MKVYGTVLDTSANNPIKGAVILAVRLSDSVLVSYTRSGPDGSFLLPKTPIDTFQVIIQYPGFGDQVFIVIGDKNNTDFNFGKVALPPKSLTINEVIIYGFKDPVYFKGDTIVYTADSFNVKQNANVEDLLKKLPGIEVDKAGNIKSRGKEVSQVLVDGDEFFGSDPTMATKNLYAESVESVQVYEKKNEDANASGSGTETITVMDLKLKDDAKKGYFGKASGATDFRKFYETEFLSNRFSKKQKISIFGLASNTPKSSIGFDDSYKYGIENDNVSTVEGDDGSISTTYRSSSSQGFPTTRKAGFYLNDKWSDKIKVNANYAYKENQLIVNNSTFSQYFLPDTTYSTDNSEKNSQTTRSNTFNFKYSQTLDSLTTLDIEPTLIQNTTRFTKEISNRFISEDDLETRKTLTLNGNTTNATDFGTKVYLNRKFQNKDRKFNIRYNFSYFQRENEGNLFTRYNYFQPTLPDSTVDQLKQGNSLETIHRTTVTYVEPLSTKMKLEFIYDLTLGNANQKRETFNKNNGDFLSKDSLLSNEFTSQRTNNQFSAGFIYETKKTRVYLGSKVRNNLASNQNLVTGADIKQRVQNLLPMLTYRYKFSDNRQLTLAFSTNSTTPTVQQLQPVPDNSNPNFVRNGNPDLLPTFANSLNGNYYYYSPLSNNHMYSGFDGRITNNDISSSTTFDDLGRTISTPINVDGNYSLTSYVGGRISVKQSLFFINYNANYFNFTNTNLINSIRNTTKTSGFGGTFGLSIEADDLEADVSYSANLNSTSSTLNSQSNKPYGSNSIQGDISYQFPKGIFFESELSYTKNTNRSDGYNIDFLIWNVVLNKKFFKRENFIVGIEANDLLNQNISTNRSIQGNVIIDSKTSIIGRYILLKATYKFDSKKEKITDDEDF